MQDAKELRNILRRIDRRGYKAYKDIQGVYSFREYTLFIDYVQGDPFASPSRSRVRLPRRIAGFEARLFDSSIKRIAFEDYLTRRFHDAAERVSKGRRGSGKSGLFTIDKPVQQVLERSSMVANDEYIEARFVIGLPAAGRRVLADEADDLIFREIPAVVYGSLLSRSIDPGAMEKHIRTVENAFHIRSRLEERGLVAFLADSAILPRRSGVDDRPLEREKTVPFSSPESLRTAFDLPDGSRIEGMGIPAGITLIVGGGYHGKSTLLNALEMGVYYHIPGDGREYVITRDDAVKIRAEDGRSIEGVDISPFISNIPFGRDTGSFSTPNASGSTSQAANIMEALEAGSRLLLIDEDTSATNFMIRDERMQRLVAAGKEPITPFIDRVGQLKSMGVSTIIVAGGSGDYFDPADTVIMMDEYKPRDVTGRAKAIAKELPTGRIKEGKNSLKPFSGAASRVLLPQSFDPSKGRRDVKITVRGRESISFGRYDIELGSVEQIVDESQTNCIADIIYYICRKYIDGKRSLCEILDLVDRDIDSLGLDRIGSFIRGDYARPRRFEIAAAINRLRSLRCRQV